MCMIHVKISLSKIMFNSLNDDVMSSKMAVFVTVKFRNGLIKNYENKIHKFTYFLPIKNKEVLAFDILSIMDDINFFLQIAGLWVNQVPYFTKPPPI